MDSVSPEELISLYFDGAATPDQRQQAELLLAESAAARTWLSQLEQMRASLNSLPKQAMPGDCLTRVMRQAEQQMLRVGRAEEPAFAASGARGVWPLHSRRQMWVAMAVAAVALIVVVLPNFFAQRGPAGGVALEKQGDTTDVAAAVAPDHKELAGLPWEAKATREAAIQTDRETARIDPQAGESVSKRRAGIRFDEAAGEGTRPLDRKKVAPARKEPATPTADEKAPASYFAESKVARTKPASALGISYVYNVPTPEAQQVVLETFEQTLREQQIVLEDSASPAPAGPVGSGALGGLAGGGAGGAGLRTGVELLPALRQTGQSPDRVYVIQATPLQLSNTLTTLNNMTVPAEGEQPVQQARVQEQLARDKQRLVEGGENQRPALTAPKGTGSTDPAQVSQSADNLTRLNHSQAIRFSTQFADAYETKGKVVQKLDGLAPGKQAGNQPAEPVLAKDVKKPLPSAAPAPAFITPPSPAAAASASQTNGTQQKQQRFGAPRGESAERAESLQRAVIIFRVVPENLEKPAETGAKK